MYLIVWVLQRIAQWIFMFLLTYLKIEKLSKLTPTEGINIQV